MLFNVTPGLLHEFPAVDDPARAAKFGLPNPFRTVHLDIGLRAADEDPPNRAVGSPSPADSSRSES